MANPGIFHSHTILRILQILTLIPAWALVAAIIADYNTFSANTPGNILYLFVVLILALAWSFCILIAVTRANNTALWITLWDTVATGLLIAGVAATADRANYECNAVPVTPTQFIVFESPTGERKVVPVTTPIVTADPNSTGHDGTGFWNHRDYCGLLRSAWGLAIVNIVFFILSAVLALVIYRQNVDEERGRNSVAVGKVLVHQPEYPQIPMRARGARRSISRRKYNYG